MSPAYQLVRLRNGVCSVRSTAYAETFHPVVGPVAEAEALYVGQLRLRERLSSGTGDFVVWDVGLGAAANVLTLLRAGRDQPRPIRVVSFDRTLEALAFAWGHAAELGYFAGYEAPVAALAAGGHRLEFRDGAHPVRWEVHVADFPGLLGSASAAALPQPHAILFDAHSPAANPEMWTLPLFRRIHALLDPGRSCALPTYSRSTLLRVTLLLSGFYVGTGQATGEKEETTIAANDPALIGRLLDPAWLERARRSSSAEPLHTAVYRQARLSPESWDQLQRHPQFQGGVHPPATARPGRGCTRGQQERT